jgi:hypothetical protein
MFGSSEKNGKSLKYIVDQNDEIYLEAIKQNERMISFM